MVRTLKVLAWTMGFACIAIGVYHLFGGIATVPGETDAAATVDSRERFYNAIFIGYGSAWIYAVRQAVIPARWIRALSGILLLGGIGRVLSWSVHGEPHWFQVPLSLIELLLPPVLMTLASADERAHVVPTASGRTETRAGSRHGFGD